MIHIKDNQVAAIKDYIKQSGCRINQDVKAAEWECVVIGADRELFYNCNIDMDAV